MDEIKWIVKSSKSTFFFSKFINLNQFIEYLITELYLLFSVKDIDIIKQDLDNIKYHSIYPSSLIDLLENGTPPTSSFSSFNIIIDFNSQEFIVNSSSSFHILSFGDIIDIGRFIKENKNNIINLSKYFKIKPSKSSINFEHINYII